MTGNTRQAGRMFVCKRQWGHEWSVHNMSKIASSEQCTKYYCSNMNYSYITTSIDSIYYIMIQLVRSSRALFSLIVIKTGDRRTSDSLEDSSKKHNDPYESVASCAQSKSGYSARSTAQAVDIFVFFKGLGRMSESVTDGLLSLSSWKLMSKACVASWVWVSTTVFLAGTKGTYNKRAF